LAVAASVPIALAAATSPRAQTQPQQGSLRSQEAALGARSQAALLQLYALETSLAAAESRVAEIAAEQADVERRHAEAEARLARATRTAQVSQRRLADLVRLLYEEGEVDPVAVLLGSDSLDDALTDLDGIDRAAQDNIRVVEQALQARRTLRRLDVRLTARERELEQIAAAARARTAELTAAASERRAAVAALRRERALTVRQIAALETQARAARTQTESLRRAAGATTAAPAPVAVEAEAPAAESAPAPATPPAASAGEMTVEALGYSLSGRTASGLPVGHGIVAVDPSVIPLGTRLYVPGYGEAVAADTGGAIRGAVIDLWFPTTADAHAWGRRTVVITLR
jgi:3D (Asp-Asp-Asp) domain-containing protein